MTYKQSVYGTGGLKIGPQLAAMPSVHVAWAVLIAVAVISASTSPRRWWIVLHPILTVFAVVATANHWWLDGIVAAGLLPLGWVVERRVSGWVGTARQFAAAPAAGNDYASVRT